MKSKKIFSILCAAAILLSATAITVPLAGTDVAYAEEMATEEFIANESDGVNTANDESGSGENDGGTDSDEPEELTVPQNVREENGFIVWDEVKNAYGYDLHVYDNTNSTFKQCYESGVEIDRYCYEYNLDFGDYTAEVCAFDETGVRTEYSEAITVTYSSNFTMPVNAKLSDDETFTWDEVEGTARYNIRAYNDNDEHSLYTYTWTSTNQIWLKNYLYEDGNYWITVQAMDKDYNASEWTEPILISHTNTIYLEAPQNLRFDESGENLLWDEVEGADYYYINLTSALEGNSAWHYWTEMTEQPRFDNWKQLTLPFSDGEYNISVQALTNSGVWSMSSEILIGHYNASLVETVNVPEIRFEDNWLKFDIADDADPNYKYWICIKNISGIIDNEIYNFSANYDCSVIINNRFPEGDYTANLYVTGKDGNYNVNSISFTLDTVHDETVWVPKLFYKFDTLTWDYDRVRYDDTAYFWIRVKNSDGDVAKLAKSWGEYYGDLPNLPNGEYTVDVCVYEYADKLSVWSAPSFLTRHDGSLFDKENETTEEVERAPEAEAVPEEDRITSITINPAFNMKNKNDEGVELDLTKIKIKAKEIYDEEGLQRASEALGETISGNKHYNLLDLTLLYDGEDFSNGYDGLVQVIIPIPAGHRDKKFSCFRLTEIDGKMVKEEIPGEQTEDSYIIYLEHFSEYAMVGGYDEEEEHTHVFGENWENDETSHWKECACGEKSDIAPHNFSEWTITKEATEDEEGEETRACQVCGKTEKRAVAKLPSSGGEEHTHVFGENWESDETSHWKECACGEKSDIAPHNFGEWTITKEATEDEEGEETRTCQVCGKAEKRAVAKLPSSGGEEHTHVFGENWESDKTNHWKECACGEKSDIAPHSFGEWTITKEATEDENGEQTRECEICGEVETMFIPKLTPEQSGSISSNISSGSFTVPEKKEETSENTEQTTVITAAMTDSSVTNDSSLDFTNTESAEVTENNVSNVPTETISETAQTDSSANTSSISNNVTDDKNINTGVVIAVIPAVAAAMAVVIFKKRN